MHGFLNLLAAALFAHVDGAGERDLVAVLREEDPGAFQLTPEAFAFRGRAFTADQIAATPRAAVRRLRLVLVLGAGRRPARPRDALSRAAPRRRAAAPPQR